MTHNTAQLLKAKKQGAKIVCDSNPYDGWEAIYEPVTKRDPMPWRIGSIRYRASELRVEWPNGEPKPEVVLGENQKDILKELVKARYWSPGCGWLWANRSKTMRLLDGLVRKGLAVQTSSVPYKERYEPTQEGREAVAPKSKLPRPDEYDLRQVLLLMAEHDGEWYTGCGWHFKNHPWTRLCLEALVHDGLVVVREKAYLMKAEGFMKAREAGWGPSLIDEE